MKYTIFIIFAIFFLSPLIYGQTDTIQIETLTRADIIKMSSDKLLALPFKDLILIANKLGITIDELLKMQTTVASKTNLTPRETPGIISIVTDEEIKSSGARDLIDVLQMVPGINFGYDDGGVIGLQMRGNWGQEGKILLIIDGQEFNELKYNTLQFGRHFDVNQIKRIEIIRGPGSSIYGGNAELGVINVVTKKGEELNGVSIATSYSRMGKILGQENLSINAGKKINDWDISLHGFVNKGNLSDQNFSQKGIPYNFGNDGAGVSAANLNLGAEKNGLGVRLIYDTYSNEFIFNKKVFSQSFTNMLGEVKYDWKWNKKLTITPKFNFRNSTPYYKENWYRNNAISRYSGSVTLKYLLNKNINVIGGAEYCYDYGRMLQNTDSSLFDNGKRNVTFNTVSAFFQGIIKTSLVNFIIGARVDNHNVFGSAFAPRIGITRSWDRFHFKALYSNAFRSPAIGNLLLSTNLKPEKTSVVELELGYKLNENMIITTNIFDIVIDKPIIWFVENNKGSYHNEDKTGSRGIEIEYKFKYTWGYANLNYSYYEVNKNTVTDYLLAEHSDVYAGAPSHKIALQSSFNLSKKLNLSPSFIYLGKRYTDPSVLTDNRINPSLLCNLYATYSHFLIKNLEIGLGVFDLFNQNTPFVQAYNGGQQPYPRPSREVLGRLIYSF